MSSTPDPRERTSVWPAVAAVGAFLFCCAGPAVFALVAATGLGVGLARSGPYVAAGAAVVAALVIAGVFWRRRPVYASLGVPEARAHESPQSTRRHRHG